MQPKLITDRVTVEPCNIGMGYFYRGECFAYVWACKAFSSQWWKNLLVHAGRSTQDLLKAGAIARKVKR
jgi:hypothetical protein